MFTDEIKDSYVRVRLTSREKEWIKKRVKEKNTTQSKYIREIIRADIEAMPHYLVTIDDLGNYDSYLKKQQIRWKGKIYKLDEYEYSEKNEFIVLTRIRNDEYKEVTRISSSSDLFVILEEDEAINILEVIEEDSKMFNSELENVLIKSITDNKERIRVLEKFIQEEDSEEEINNYEIEINRLKEMIQYTKYFLNINKFEK